ncbi:MAG: DUF2088 domain-containing protein [Candidatus Zixiibacteriota bacterium]|nr:MAG: DUF2088 domain-containing protein [candidate division Zixibacteria bacterium]
MTVDIKYGTETISLILPDNCTFDEYRCKMMHNLVVFETFMAELSHAETAVFPLDTAELFIVNDAYRPTPTARVLRWLQDAGRLNAAASFLVATGCHRAPREEQMRDIFGELHADLRDRIFVHDAHDHDKMVRIGSDSAGYPVWINRLAYDAESIVVIGSVEPHYFAGFTGGRKSLFPGVCDFETTVRNHNLAVSCDAAPMRLTGNPVAESLSALMNMLSDKKIFGIQIVGAGDRGMQVVCCGALEDTFVKACEISRQVFGAATEKEYDLLLAEVRPPLDSDLYQLQKSLENSQGAVRDGGTILLFSPCQEGIGSEHFYRLADRWKNTADYGDTVAFGTHKLHRVNAIGKRLDLFLFSTLADGVSDRVFFRTTKSPQSIIEKLCKGNKQINTALVRDAGHTVLTVH